MNTKLTVVGNPFHDATLFRQVVGALQYITLTRSDHVSHAINKVYQFMHCPTDEHWVAVKRILRYLKHTSSHGLFLQQNSSMALDAFSDSDWAGNVDDHKSTAGYAISLGKI